MVAIWEPGVESARPSGAAAPEDRRPGLALGVAFGAACLGIAASLLHWSAVDARYATFQVEWHQKIITGDGPYPDQYRILTYWLAEGLIRLGVPFALAHETLRASFTAAFLYAFFRYLRNWFSLTSSLLGFFAVAACIPMTFLFYAMQPTDPLNALVYVLAFWAIQSERDGWLLPIVIVGMLNRNTAILLPLFYGAIRFGRPARTWIPGFMLLSAVAGGLYIGLRIVYGLKPPYAATSPLHYWQTNLTDWTAWVQFFGFFNLMLWCAWRGLKQRPVLLRRAALVLPLFFAIHFTVGYLREIRYYLAVLPVVIPLMLFRVRDLDSSTEA